MTPARLQRAAEVLREEAEALRLSHTVSGEWPKVLDRIDASARASHDEMLELAAELEAHAGPPPRFPPLDAAGNCIACGQPQRQCTCPLIAAGTRIGGLMMPTQRKRSTHGLWWLVAIVLIVAVAFIMVGVLVNRGQWVSL